MRLSEIRLELPLCTRCGGTGKEPHEIVEMECPDCEGTGKDLAWVRSHGNKPPVRESKGIYKVYVNTHGDPEDSWATNGINYDTVPIAEEAAKDLFMRWTAVKKWRVMDVTETTVYAEGP